MLGARSERLTWTVSEPYSESMRVPDYNLLRENGIVYISERNFDLSYKELLDGFAADAAKVRDAKLIIFDIRANGGGTDEFGRSWVENFCGQQPETTAALWAAIQGSQAGTPEDPIPAARGMEYQYGLYYLDPEDSQIYLCRRTGEEEGGKVVLQYLPHELVGQYFEVVE